MVLRPDDPEITRLMGFPKEHFDVDKTVKEMLARERGEGKRPDPEFFLRDEGPLPQSLNELLNDGFGLGAKIRAFQINQDGSVERSFGGIVTGIREDVFFFRESRARAHRWLMFDSVSRGFWNIDVIEPADASRVEDKF